MKSSAQIEFVPVSLLFSAKPSGNILFLTEPVNEQEIQDRDIELLRQIAGGDRTAFAEFYDRHATLMFSIASRILNDSGEAEDVLQVTFVQIWETAGKFDSKIGKPSSWVSTLVRNKAIDRVRASQRRTRLAEAAGAEQAVVTEAPDSANESLYGHDKARVIQSVIVALPMEQRQAIELAFFSGLTQDEISKKLSEPLGTIKARIRRGLFKLRDQLEGLL